MATPDLDLLARAGAELSVMFEMNYAPQDNPTHFLEVNPDGARVLRALFDRLVEAGVPVPEELAFLVNEIWKRA